MHGLQPLRAICVIEHAHAALQGASQEGLLGYACLLSSAVLASLNIGSMLDTWPPDLG